MTIWGSGPSTDRLGGVFVVLLMVGVGAYGFLTQPSQDSTNAIDSAGQVDAFDVRLGDCFNDEIWTVTDEASEINSLNAVPCAQPHDNEIFAVFDLELAVFPESGAMDDAVNVGCLQRFEPYVGRDYDTSSLEISSLFPTRESWNERGDREVVCFLFDMELSKIQGSMKATGDD